MKTSRKIVLGILMISQLIIFGQNTGVVDGSGSVNNTGGFSYRIPIKLPSGNNMEPDLAIGYSSQGGNGLLGMGGSMSGLSVIEYDNRDVYHDGYSNSIDISKGNPLLLDGSRLVLKTGSYGTSGSTYGLEEENYSTITSYGNSSGCTDCPLYFKVKTKSGIIMEYGNTSDSRYMSTDGTRPIFWRLNKMTDINGNYITYSYLNTDGQARIDEINYTGNSNAGVLPYNKIKFNYTTRILDQNVRYYSGAGMSATAINQKYLLDKITITTEGGALVKSYQMAYQNNGRYNFLLSVTEKGSDGSSLLPTTFSLRSGANDGLTSVSTQATNNLFSSKYFECQSGDFNGDGRKELFVVYHNGQIPRTYINYKIYSYDDYGAATIYAQGTITQPTSIGYKYRGFQVSDFDGNGRADIAMYKVRLGTPNYNTAEEIRILYTNNAGSFSQTVTDYNLLPGSRAVAIENSDNTTQKDIDRYGILGDFDGDGRTDIMTRSLTIGEYRLHLLAKNELNYALSTSSVGGDVGAYPISSDVDGDGKGELRGAIASNSKVLHIEKNGTSYQFVSKFQQVQFSQEDNNSLYGDFNGDNKHDIFYSAYHYTLFFVNTEPESGYHVFIPQEGPHVVNNYSSNYQSGVCHSTGFGYTPQGIPSNYSTQAAILNEQHIVADFNGDGKDDLLRYSPAPNSLRLQLSTGMGFSSEQYITHGAGNSFRIVNISDINGDGSTDIVTSDSVGLKVITFKNMITDRRILKISNGQKDFEVGYVNLNNSQNISSLYTSPSTNIYPLVKSNGRTVVCSSKKITTQGITNQTNYTYKNAMIHIAGKGFLGFEQIIEDNQTTGYKNTKNYILQTPYYVNWLSNETISKNNVSTKSSQYFQNFTSVSADNKRYKMELSSTLSQDNLLSKNVNTIYTYDNYGNITQKVVSVNNGLETIVTGIIYKSGGNTTPAQPETITYTKTRNRSGSPTSSFNKTTVNTFDYLGRLQTTTEFSGLPKEVKTTYVYNNFGDVTSKLTTTGGQSRGELYQYTSNGRYISSVIKNIGGSNQVQSYSYDTRWDKPLSSIDATNLVTTYAYDGFGRLITVAPPSPKLPTNISYTYDGGSFSGSVFKITKTHAGTPTQMLYIDAYGRTSATSVVGFSGTNRISEQVYDNQGNLITTKVPKATGTGQIITNYTYDNYNRLANKIVSGIGTTVYSPALQGSDYSISITEPSGKIATVTYDATGKKVKYTDAGGILNYYYNATGDVLQILKGTDILTAATYDTYGKQITLLDKDVNATIPMEYEYDGWGNLTKQIDSKGNKTEYTLDNWGRVLTEKLTDGSTSAITTTNYEYVNSGNGLNQLFKVTGFNNIVETYEYDVLNRPYKLTQNFEGINYVTTNQYDYNDRIIKTTYPSGFEANYTFNSNGYLTTVKNTNNVKTLYAATAMNAYDQVTQFQLGNNPVSNHSYNDYGMPLDFVTSGVQNLHMEYANLATGNMTLRKDVLKNLTETFTYDDAADRLVSTKVGTGLAKNISYSTDGNITSKDDAGSEYLYEDPNHIHAVTKIKSSIYGGSDPYSEPCDISTETPEITYTAFNQPSLLKQGVAPAIVKELSYTYRANHQRIKSEYKENGVVKTTRYYFGNYEKEKTNGIVNEIHYIPTGVGLGCMMVKTNGVENYYYTYKDHQGSILKVVNEAGTATIAEQSFDAWGRPRNVNNWTFTGLPTNTPTWLYRGYTGHEMVAGFDLINMNGRMYDYINSRMLSPDQLTHDEFGAQGYNRYSYVANNPLKYTDPTGQDYGDDDDDVENPINNIIGSNGLTSSPSDYGYDCAEEYFGTPEIVGGPAGDSEADDDYTDNDAYDNIPDRIDCVDDNNNNNNDDDDDAQKENRYGGVWNFTGRLITLVYRDKDGDEILLRNFSPGGRFVPEIGSHDFGFSTSGDDGYDYVSDIDPTLVYIGQPIILTPFLSISPFPSILGFVSPIITHLNINPFRDFFRN